MAIGGQPGMTGAACRPAVAPHLRGWLNEASAEGSGDDISLGVLWR